MSNPNGRPSDYTDVKAAHSAMENSKGAPERIYWAPTEWLTQIMGESWLAAQNPDSYKTEACRMFNEFHAQRNNRK